MQQQGGFLDTRGVVGRGKLHAEGRVPVYNASCVFGKANQSSEDVLECVTGKGRQKCASSSSRVCSALVTHLCHKETYYAEYECVGQQ